MKKNIFNSIKFPAVGSNWFDKSHDNKFSTNMGVLTPTFLEEVIPGDRFKINPTLLLRFAPMVAPVMHRIKANTHFFFVPNRILWSEWENFISNKTDVQAPYIQVESVAVGSLADYLGIPTGDYEEVQRISAIPFAAYLTIYNQFYRDQNLQVEYNTTLVPGNNTTTYEDWLFNPPPRRSWQHDYFTAALPFAQAGSSVQVPLTVQDDIPVQWTDAVGAGPGQFVDSAGNPVNGDLVQSANVINASPDTQALEYDPQGSLVVDVQSDAVDINTLRRAFRLQEFLERMARGGRRYIELVLSHFGVRSSDSRLDRPEYMGGSTQFVTIGEVLATAESTDTAVGQMAGHGISLGGGNAFSYSAEEHGYIVGIVSVRPDTAYQQGIHRHWDRTSYLDYAWPTFAHIGEQEVKHKEVYAVGDDSNVVFGYVPRYAEYRYSPSRVAGQFRTTLDHWHLGRIFNNNQALNSQFITCNPSTRIFAVTDEDEHHLYCHQIFQVSARRKLPQYGVPSF